MVWGLLGCETEKEAVEISAAAARSGVGVEDWTVIVHHSCLGCFGFDRGTLDFTVVCG